MSRLPSAAASRNMSACSAQAMSHVGCRLMVASSANTSRPLLPAACGDIALALATKAAMSSAADGMDSGSEPLLPASDILSADFGLIGSPDIEARELVACPMWAATPGGSMHRCCHSLAVVIGIADSRSQFRENGAWGATEPASVMAGGPL